MADEIKSLDGLEAAVTDNIGGVQGTETEVTPVSRFVTNWAAPMPPASVKTRSPAFGSSPVPARSS